MKSKLNKKKTATLIALVLSVVLICTALVIYACAAGGGETVDAMVEIESELSSYKVGDTVSVADDGYIGIPVEVSTYYDTAKGVTKPGYNGTPLIVYVVNTNIERIGKKSDVEIISSLLDRGYVVQIFDYLNSTKAVSPDLDWSTQQLRQKSKSGAYFTSNTYLKSGTYYDTILIPAGYDVSLNNVFWETDKHGADGDLEKIVENWNTDLRSWFRDTVIYWRNSEGAQKATQKGFDDSEVVWYSDAKGTAVVDKSSTSANYVKLQHTLAYDITDCVGKDGTPIDLNLYMHVVYPTSDKNDALDSVPVIALANSSEYLSNGLNTADRPQFSGFLFNGYAGVIYDYLYQPMAQSDYYGYYDGRTALGAMTGDHMNYGLQLYDDKRVNTAAIRYVRYLTLTDPDTYSFDIDKIGVIGNSKGGWFTFLGEAELREYTEVPAGMTLAEAMDDRINSYTSKRTYGSTRGETRYQNMRTEDYTRNGVTIDGGELQPWLTYKDKNGNEHEILSYASWIYASCGSQHEDITEGHAPVFCALQMQDDFTTTHNLFAEITASLDIPSIYVIVDNGHTFAYGLDYYHGFETYDAMFDFANYYLKNAAVKVIYTDPVANTGRLDTTPSITVKFSGEVSIDEIEKITLVSGTHTATGEWSSARGNTEWTFKADALLPGAEYTLTVPADMVGDNGTKMGTAYTTTFFTEDEDTAAVTVTRGTLGNYFTLTVPETLASDAKIRFHVANDAANIAELYAVSGFDSAAPDSSVKGELVDSVSLCGSGYYEIDVTEYVYSAEAGSSLTFLLTAKKTAGETEKVISFASSVSSVSFGSYVRGSVDTAPDGTSAAKVYVTANVKSNGSLQYPHERLYYVNLTSAMTVKQLFGSTLTESDLGRQYRVTMRVYDTDTRYMQLALNRVSGNLVHDKNVANYVFETEAGKWQEISFDYTVYEPMYGEFGLQPKTLTVSLGSTGRDESPIYISDITITETVTGIELASDAASLALGTRGDAYKKDSTSKAFTIGSTGYDSFKAALAAAKTGDTVVMNKNYTLTDADDFTGWGALERITIDLNGYKLYNASANPVIHAAATSVSIPKTVINITGGEIYLSAAPLIGYAGTTFAGDGKTFDINVNGTGILNAPGSTLTAFFSEADVSSAAINVNVSLTNADVDFTRSMNSMTPVSLFANGSATLSVDYKLCGGSIYVDNFANLSVFDTFKKTEFVKDSGGSYTVLLTGEGAIVPDIAVTTSTTIASFKRESAEANVATYTVQGSPLSTKYGIIPEEYASVENYPFVLFDEKGNFIGAYNCWLGNNGTGSVLGAAKAYVVNAWDGTSYGADPKEAFVVMRRDYTFDPAKDSHFDNLAQTQGTINIDLGGFTLANSSAVDGKGIFPADSKGFGGAAGNKIFPTTIKVTNGALRAYNWGIVQASTWDSVGGGAIAGKDFNFIFDKVTIGFTGTPSGGGLIFHRKDATSTTVAAPFNLTFNDCVIDTTTQKSSHGCTVFKLNAPTNQYVKVTYVMNGGKIITDGVSTITLAETNSDGSTTHGSSLVFGKGENGEYASYYIPESSSKTLAVGQWNTTDGEVYGFFENGTESVNAISYKRYTLAKNPLVTKYGTIPDDKKDADAYPFAVFSCDASGNYKYDNAYATLKSAVGRAKSINSANTWDTANKTYGASEKSSVVLFRRDYTATSTDNYNDYGQNQGMIVIDLNGFTLTQGSGSNSAFANITAKGWSGSGDAPVFPSTFTVKNGKVLVNDKPVIVADTWHTVTGNGEMAAKIFTWNFDSVEFGFVAGATSTDLLVSYKNPQSSAGEVVIPFVFNYNDCTFDMTNAPAGAKLFNAATSTGTGKWIKSTVTVSGGEIKAPSLTLAQLFSIDGTNTYGSSVTFKKDANGEYTKLYITNGGAAPTGDVATDSGSMSYAKISTGASETLYVLSSLKTPYGTIPADKASIEDYPFVVFDTDGRYYGAFKEFHGNRNGAFNTAIYTVLRDYNKWDPATGEYIPDEGSDGVRTAVIYMRRDYTLSASEYHDNMAHTQGTIIIDLGGYTMYSDSTRTKPLFDAIAKGWSGTDDGNLVFPTSVSVKNGAIKTHSASVINFVCWDSVGGNAIANKTMSFTFEDVTFGLMRGATVANPIIAIGDAKTTSGTLPANVTFNDCIFDFETVAPTVETTVFNAAFASKYYIKGTIVINGGKLLADSMTNVKLYALDTARGSSITFGKGSDGKYFEAHLDSGAAAPAFTLLCNTAAGETTLTYSSKADGKDIYTLEASIVTKYGNIPARFASVEKYPFAVFRNGKFVVATALFAKDASESAIHSSKNAGSVVLMRRDFTYNESRYNNLSQTYGVTIDLGGFTFTSKSLDVVFYAQKKTDHDTTVNVINGTILTSGSPLIRFSSWTSSGKYPGSRNFIFNFEEVTIGVAEGSNPSVFLAKADKNISEPMTYNNVTFTDCTIDITGLSSSTVFDIADPSGIIRVNVQIVGGTIRSDGFDGIVIGAVESTYNSLTFVKGSDGEYTKLYLKSGATAPTEQVNAENGKLAFVRSATEGEWGIYKLSTAVLNEFKPKISVTLYSDFIFNIYIPATDGVESIEFCGETVALNTLEKKTVDGAEYYVFHKAQAPSAAAEEFGFRVGLNTGDKTVYGNWTVSIVKYANLVLGDSESTEVEKTLIKDILSYVRSAYVYFKSENEAYVKAKIDAIIGEDYDETSLPTDMESAEVGGGFDSATFRLDAKPSFVFYPETDDEGNLVYDLGAYRFTQNGKTLAYETETVSGRTCIVIAMYAYEISEDIAYSVDGTEISGEFNIKAYYEFAKTQNDDALVSIVERLWKYSESANEYRLDAISGS